MRRITFGLAVAVVALAACGSDEGGSADGDIGGSTSVSVSAANFAFSPSEISVDPGAEVDLTFANDDDAGHTFTSDELGIDLEAAPGETAEDSFTAPGGGTIEWHCEIHPDMTGTVTVSSDAGAEGSDDDDMMESDDSKVGKTGGGYDY